MEKQDDFSVNADHITTAGVAVPEVISMPMTIINQDGRAECEGCPERSEKLPLDSDCMHFDPTTIPPSCLQEERAKRARYN